MDTQNGAPPADAAPSTPPRVMAEPQRTKNQVKASMLADGVAMRAKWKSLVAEARQTWPKVPAEDLTRVDGNFNVLAGLVQLRNHVSREESDRQVREFFDKHYSEYRAK